MEVPAVVYNETCSTEPVNVIDAAAEADVAHEEDRQKNGHDAERIETTNPDSPALPG